MSQQLWGEAAMMPERIPLLMAALERTEAAVEKLTKSVAVHEWTLRRVKVVTGVAMFGLVLDLTLTVLVGLGLVGLGHNQDRITTLQARVAADTARARAAQCASIKLFLQFEPRTTRSPNYTDDEKKRQVEAYAVLRRIGADLGCPAG